MIPIDSLNTVLYLIAYEIKLFTQTITKFDKTSVPNDSKNHKEPKVCTNSPPHGKVAWLGHAGTYVIPIIGRRSTIGKSSL